MYEYNIEQFNSPMGFGIPTFNKNLVTYSNGADSFLLSIDSTLSVVHSVNRVYPNSAFRSLKYAYEPVGYQGLADFFSIFGYLEVYSA